MKLITKEKLITNKLDLWEVREHNHKNRLPRTVVAFKCFKGKTPSDLCKKVFGAYGNEFPFDFFPTQTRVDYDYNNRELNSDECLIFYVFTGIVPPKIEIPDVLYCYRKGIDSDLFNSVQYENVTRFHGSYIQNLSYKESSEKVKILKDLVQNYKVEVE